MVIATIHFFKEQSVILQDVCTLGVVNIRYCGYVAVVKVNYEERLEADRPLETLDIEDQPEGSNALNINRLL